MKHLLSGVMVLSLLCIHATVSVHAQLKPLQFKEYDLPNGLHVILHEDHRAPVVATVVHYKVGSRDEEAQRTGFAHFFEHLMFEGTDKIERGTIDKLINGAGGQLNAYTSTDETVYHFVVPSNEFRLPLWIEAQRMRKLVVNQVGVETQRGVVKEERKNRYDNAPYGGWQESSRALLFAGTPYAWSPIGSSQHIDSAMISEFVDFYNRFYQPNNAVLVVAGDFDEAVARETINAYFGGYAKAPEPPRPNMTSFKPLQAVHRDTIMDKKAQLPGVFMSFVGVDLKQEDAYAMEILTTILSDGESSRLYREVVDSQRVAVQVSSFHIAQEYGGMASVIGIVSPGKSTEDAERAIWATLRSVMDNGVTAAELEKARNIAESRTVGSLADMRSKAMALGSNHRYYGRAARTNEELEHYQKVKPADVQRVAKKVFGASGYVVLTYLPVKG